MPVTTLPFGTAPDGHPTHLYLLSNGRGMVVGATDLGACLVSCRVPDREGRLPDVLLGYVLAEDLHLQRMVAEFVFSVEHINNEVIVKAQSGTAPGIAAAIDAADMPEIVATIAGNDTVLGICRSEEKAVAAEGMIKKLQHPDGKSTRGDGVSQRSG